MSDIPKFGVYKGMMTSHEESIVSKVEYTDANREKLAEAVVENMDIKDMIQALYEQELECYERCEDTFQELWHNYYGDEDE
mgnify:FL=1|jgi:hypothetical protein